MEAKSKGIELLLTIEEAVALTKLLSMSRMGMMEHGGIDLDEANLLQIMYSTLSAFVPNEQAA